MRACSGPRTRIWATTATRGRSTTKTSAPRTKGESSESGEYECDQWKSGDVIGLACDLDKMQMHVSLNGSFAAPNGDVFELAPDAVGDGLFAAFSGISGTVRYNFGEVPFRHAPPAADFQAYAGCER